MIDLRSDTLSTPTTDMLQAIVQAELGDDGRLTQFGKGEDPTVNKLEHLAAEMTGKEDALLTPSGTMANILALLIQTDRNGIVAIDKQSHIYTNETSLFSEKYFGRKAQFFETDHCGVPKLEHLEKLLINKEINLITIENSIAYKGGTCIPAKKIKEISRLACIYNVPVHMDGARIFNVATYYRMPVKHFTAHVDTVQFCLSKGLSAPIGSLLCGPKSFIQQAREVRKIIGGGMRQAGIIAAAGLVSLTKVAHQLSKDHENAKLLVEKIKNNRNLIVNSDSVQTNIILIDVSPSNQTAIEVSEQLKKHHLIVRPVTKNKIRLMTYRNITKNDIEHAASIINTVLT